MTPPRAAEFLEFALATARAAGDVILPHFRAPLDVADKSGGKGYDPVTIADRAAESVITAAIAKAYPDHGIRGEEHGRRAGASRYTWVIDPIDGTRSFILGQMHWATLIALHDGERIVVGVAHQPYVGESFAATAGGPAEWRRGSDRRTLVARRCASVADAVVACTDPKMFETAAARAAFDRVASRARLTRWGGDCYAYCLLAMGLDRRRDRSLARGLRRAGADPDRRGGRRGDDRMDRRPVRRRREGRRLRGPLVAPPSRWRSFPGRRADRSTPRGRALGRPAPARRPCGCGKAPPQRHGGK